MEAVEVGFKLGLSMVTALGVIGAGILVLVFFAWLIFALIDAI